MGFRIPRFVFILLACWVVASITGEWWTCVVLYLIYLLTELVTLCLEAESRTRAGMERSKIKANDEPSVKWYDKRLGLQHFYKTDEKLRRSFRVPFCWLPVSWLWRVSLWIYFW